MPRRIRYDNLKPAVVRVMKCRGRFEIERFIATCNNYGFESFFCQPGIKGTHENGGVVGELGRARRHIMVPISDVRCLVALNDLVTNGDERDGHRDIPLVSRDSSVDVPVLSALRIAARGDPHLPRVRPQLVDASGHGKSMSRSGRILPTWLGSILGRRPKLENYV